MGKKKSKTQKKKFFAHPKNKGRVFKKKDIPKPDGNTIRRRGNFSVLSTSGFPEVPHCSHGPCLLFGSKTNGVITKRFFACAVYRNDMEFCDFVVDVDENDEILSVPPLPKKAEEDWQYGCIPKKLKSIPKESTLVFCRQCNDVFEKKHRCPSEIVERSVLKIPTEFLEALDRQSGEAQFFFSDESLQVLLNTINNSKVAGVLCIGSPRIFESLKLTKTTKGEDLKLFMLDIDKRYAHFFPSTQFAQYSMLVDYFFDDKAPAKLNNFFSKCESVLLVCDPPFGVFIEPLMESVLKMKARHEQARKGLSCSFYASILVPFFVGKHILRLDKTYWMSDYRITYSNHKVFNKASKTTVRMFTNLPVLSVDLSAVEGYKYCDSCEKYVHDSNKHCFMCMDCTSKDGSASRHCERCSRCVKASYKHCRECSRCHLPGRCFQSLAKQGEEVEEEEYDE